MGFRLKIIFLFATLLILPACQSREGRGAQFIGFTHFDAFQKEVTTVGITLLSPTNQPSIDWNELVPSWNYRASNTHALVIEIRVIYPDHSTTWYDLGHWSLGSNESFRRSVNEQKDNDGTVATDTLKMRRHGGQVQVRVKILGADNFSGLKLLGLSFCDTRELSEALPPNKRAWGKNLTVPERSQANYPEGIAEWCSPTAVSMILSYWSLRLDRPDLDHDVPEVARAVHDPTWPGTGNWPFNTAYVGSHKGMRGYIARLTSIRELEDWIDSGIPVAISVSYGLLKGASQPGNGHLVVCTGFTADGDIMVNDPGRKAVPQVYPRENLLKAWRNSMNTAYLIYPEDHPIPPDPYNHWTVR